MQTFSRHRQRPVTTDGISLNAPYMQGESRPSSQSADHKQRYGATRASSAFLRKPPKPNRHTNKLRNTEQIIRRHPGTPLPVHKKLQAAQKTQYIAIVFLFFLAFLSLPEAPCLIFCHALDTDRHDLANGNNAPPIRKPEFAYQNFSRSSLAASKAKSEA
ncbi:hypothetical protein [Burkholderia multivorans]|uniref:hypothetical protein n=1 Tax=Burkholderia multivorans TaxID=87883 RepID=UPI0021BF18F4|nr:hypothetical protein [Burkholderia multivorans]